MLCTIFASLCGLLKYHNRVNTVNYIASSSGLSVVKEKRPDQGYNSAKNQ
jgi:hypothetical protein